jgi:hypothetical protein
MLLPLPSFNVNSVAVHKENVKQRSQNKQLVNDDPKGNTVLCDGGMPYFNPPDYQYNRLTWQTFYGDQPQAGGVDTGDPPAPVTPETPAPPVTPPTSSEDVPCPPPNARRNAAVYSLSAFFEAT